MGIFSWQTAVIKWMRDRMENRRIPQYNSYSIYDNRLGGGDWNEMYITPEEKIYMGAPLALLSTFFNLSCRETKIFLTFQSSLSYLFVTPFRRIIFRFEVNKSFIATYGVPVLTFISLCCRGISYINAQRLYRKFTVLYRGEKNIVMFIVAT